MATSTAPGPRTAASPTSRRRRTWRDLPVAHQLRQSVGVQRGMLVTGLVLTGVFVLVALLAPLVAPYRWAQREADGRAFDTLQPPGGDHLLGTTQGGYDVLSRVLWGAQTALQTMVIAVVLSIFVGVALGLVSGYVGGWLDRVLVVVADAIYAFPTLLLAIVASIAISGGQSSKWGGIFAAAVSITVVFIPQYLRVIRAETVRIKAEAYVESAKVVGASTGRIMFRHVLRNATRTLPLIFTLNCSEALLTLAGLGFLGFGIEPNSGAEWGYDLNRAVGDVTSGVWWTGLFPGLAIVLAVLGVTLVGESLNDLADPRLRGRRSVAAASGTVAATSVVPGGTLDSAAGLETPDRDTDGFHERQRVDPSGGPGGSSPHQTGGTDR